MLRRAWMMLALGSALQGAVFAQDKPVELQPMDSYPAKQTVGSVTVAAEAYGSDAKCAEIFRIKDLTTRGYFPVHVVIQNSGTEYVTISTRKILLDLGAGQGLYTTSAALVVEDVAGGAFENRKSKDNPITDATLINFTGRELVNRAVAPGTVEHGFVFFFTPTPKKDFFSGAKLVIPLIDDATRKEIGPFTLPLNPQ